MTPEQRSDRFGYVRERIRNSNGEWDRFLFASQNNAGEVLLDRLSRSVLVAANWSLAKHLHVESEFEPDWQGGLEKLTVNLVMFTESLVVSLAGSITKQGVDLSNPIVVSRKTLRRIDVLPFDGARDSTSPPVNLQARLTYDSGLQFTVGDTSYGSSHFVEFYPRLLEDLAAD